MKTTFLKHSIVLIASVVCINAAHAQAIVHSHGDYYMYVDDDSSVNPVQTLITYRSGQERYDIKMALDKVTELYVNNRKIPADSFFVYNSLIVKLKEQIKKDRAQAVEDMKQAALDRVQAGKDQEQAGRDQQQAELDRKQAMEDDKQAQKDQVGAVQDQRQAELDRKQAMEDIEQAKKDDVQAGKDQQQAELDRAQAELDRKQAEEDRVMIKNLLSDIVADHITPDEKSVKHVVLNEDEFIVNGRQQSAELLKKYKEKYVKKPGYSLRYGGSTSGYGIYFDNEGAKDKQ